MPSPTPEETWDRMFLNVVSQPQCWPIQHPIPMLPMRRTIWPYTSPIEVGTLMVGDTPGTVVLAHCDLYTMIEEPEVAETYRHEHFLSAGAVLAERWMPDAA